MAEGQKISELNEVSTLQNGCCFPIVSNGSTQKIAFVNLVENVKNNLPHIESEAQLTSDVSQLKTKYATHDNTIAELQNETTSLIEDVENVKSTVQGQNITIERYTGVVSDLERTVEETHFDDVLALEGQVVSNTNNISDLQSGKQNTLTEEQLAAVNSGVTSNNYQPKLISGSNIKTVNNQSLLGSGNISIYATTKYFHVIRMWDTNLDINVVFTDLIYYYNNAAAFGNALYDYGICTSSDTQIMATGRNGTKTIYAITYDYDNDYFYLNYTDGTNGSIDVQTLQFNDTVVWL